MPDALVFSLVFYGLNASVAEQAWCFSDLRCAVAAMTASSLQDPLANLGAASVMIVGLTDVATGVRTSWLATDYEGDYADVQAPDCSAWASRRRRRLLRGVGEAGVRHDDEDRDADVNIELSGGGGGGRALSAPLPIGGVDIEFDVQVLPPGAAVVAANGTVLIGAAQSTSPAAQLALAGLLLANVQAFVASLGAAGGANASSGDAFMAPFSPLFADLSGVGVVAALGVGSVAPAVGIPSNYVPPAVPNGKGAEAGAIIGALLGSALLLGLAFYFSARHRRDMRAAGKIITGHVGHPSTPRKQQGVAGSGGGSSPSRRIGGDVSTAYINPVIAAQAQAARIGGGPTRGAGGGGATPRHGKVAGLYAGTGARPAARAGATRVAGSHSPSSSSSPSPSHSPTP